MTRLTYHLAVDLFDRYLSLVKVPRNTLQLVAVTALFIASKMEEIYPPKLKEFAYITDGACNQRQIMEMEKLILQVCCYYAFIMTPQRNYRS